MGPYFSSWYASGVPDSIYSRASKLIGFTAGESAGKCVGSTADPASRQHVGSTASAAAPNASTLQSTGPTNVSAAEPTPHQQHLAVLIQPKSPTEVLVSRFPHSNGVTWIFHDPANGSVRHVNVPYVYPVAQQQANQGSVQASTNNEMVLYHQPSNQITQHTM